MSADHAERQARRWKGRRLVGSDKEPIGAIVDVYTDPPQPTWGLVRVRRLPPLHRVVPLDGARSTDLGVVVPFDRATVLAAPTIEPGAPTPREAERLTAHYPTVTPPDPGPAAAPPPTDVQLAPDGELATALAEARFREERLSLYRAKMFGPRPTSQQHFRELERARDGAVDNLRRLRERREATPQPSGPRHDGAEAHDVQRPIP